MVNHGEPFEAGMKQGTCVFAGVNILTIAWKRCRLSGVEMVPGGLLHLFCICM